MCIRDSIHDTSIATWIVSAVASHCDRDGCPCLLCKLASHESSMYARAGMPFARKNAAFASLSEW